MNRNVICSGSSDSCGQCDHRFPHFEAIDCNGSRCSTAGYVDCIDDIKKIRKMKLLKLKNESQLFK